MPSTTVLSVDEPMMGIVQIFFCNVIVSDSTVSVLSLSVVYLLCTL